MNLRTPWSLLKDTASKWMGHNAPRLGAALAYYSIFSIAPLLVIVLGIAGLVFGQKASQGLIFKQAGDMVGEDGAEAIRTMVEHASFGSGGLVGTILGIVMLLFGAAGLFGELQSQLNLIWGVEPKPGRGFLGMVRDRFLSFTMVLGVAFLLLVSLVVSAALSALMGLFGAWQASLVGHAVSIVVSLAVVTLLFAMIFRFLPDAKIAWNDVWLGAAVTALLFTVGKFLIGFYLGRAGIASAYGAVGSLAVLLIWLYYSAQIFLFGAELTRAYADRFGSRIVPAANAVAAEGPARQAPGVPAADRRANPNTAAGRGP